MIQRSKYEHGFHCDTVGTCSVNAKDKILIGSESEKLVEHRLNFI